MGKPTVTSEEMTKMRAERDNSMSLFDDSCYGFGIALEKFGQYREALDLLCLMQAQCIPGGIDQINNVNREIGKQVNIMSGLLSDMLLAIDTVKGHHHILFNEDGSPKVTLDG